jgi:hypothetical protein
MGAATPRPEPRQAASEGRCGFKDAPMRTRFTIIAATLTALAFWPAAAQTPGCLVDIGRGAAQGGSQGNMRVVPGRSCGASLYIRPQTQTPTTSVTLATPPAHGTVVITQPNRFDYIPAAGFSGADSFVITALPAPFRVTMTVTVQPR